MGSAYTCMMAQQVSLLTDNSHNGSMYQTMQATVMHTYRQFNVNWCVDVYETGDSDVLFLHMF